MQWFFLKIWLQILDVEVNMLHPIPTETYVISSFTL